MDGQVFGDVDPDPLSMSGEWDPTGFTVSATDDVWGPISISWNGDGSVEGEATPAGDDDVLSFAGNHGPQKMRLDYAFTDPEDGVTAQGSITLTPDP